MTEQDEIALELCLLTDKDGKPLLEGVREECKCGKVKSACWHCYLERMHGQIQLGAHSCLCECQGRGWVPSTDPWKWFEAVGNIGGSGISIAPLTAKEAASIVSSIFEGELAFFRALKEALSA